MKRLIQSRGGHPRSSENPRLPTAALTHRSGTTLSEVLISLMVMSIGVVSLATLFPISVLRSIQASQLTNATIHRLNAEELISLFPRLVHDPDYNGNLAEHELPNTSGFGFDNPDNTVDGVNEGRFIVDPVGWNRAELNSVQSMFGNGSAVPAGQQINRYHGGFNDVTPPIVPSQDPRIAYLPDSWQLLSKGTAPTLDAPNHTITVGSGVDTVTTQQTLSSLGAGSVRLVLFSANGKSSVTRSVTNITGNVISWDDGSALVTTDDLPATGYASILRFRLESYDTRYSWLLTVRKTQGTPAGQGKANVDVVVFHKRAFSAAAEQVYTTNLIQGNTTCTISVPQGPGLPKPFLKNGSFLFDAQNAHWYRITKVIDGVNPVVSIDRPAVTASNRVMALPGIVEVYPIDPKSFNP